MSNATAGHLAATHGPVQLPHGWRFVRLRDLIREAQPGFACGERDPRGVVQLRMNNVDTQGKFVWDTVLRVPVAHGMVERFRLEPGDVLFNNTNSTELVGKSALFHGYSEPVVYSNHFTRLRTNPDALLPAFLAAWLTHQWQRGVFAGICNRWIGQSAVKADKLLTLFVPLPPLAEQRRIVAALSEKIAAVEKARTAAEERRKAVKSLPAAFRRQAFPSPAVPLPKGWRLIRLQELSNRIDYGYTAAADPARDSPRFLRITDIQDGIVVWDRVPGCLINSEDTEKYRLCAGDIVFARTGATTGKSYLIDDPPLAVFASYLIRVRALTDLVLPDFLYSFFQSDWYWQRIAAGVRGGAQGGFNASMLGDLMVPCPSLDEQYAIASRLRKYTQSVRKANCSAERELASIESLRSALIRHAWQGGL